MHPAICTFRGEKEMAYDGTKEIRKVLKEKGIKYRVGYGIGSHKVNTDNVTLLGDDIAIEENEDGTFSVFDIGIAEISAILESWNQNF